MRHNNRGRKFHRTAEHRKAMFMNLAGALIKNEQDVHLFERLAFMTRRQSRDS